MTGQAERFLLGDIGGTHTRLLLAPCGGRIDAGERVLETGAFDSAEAALEAFLADAGGASAVALCGAGPLEGQGADARIHLTNAAWTLDARRLSERFGLPVLLLNDFTACALGLPDLEGGQVEQIGGGAAEASHPIAAIGAGTGLGTATLVPRGQDWTALPGEGGQTSLPATTERELAVLGLLSARLGHVPAEQILSGPGLQNLHGALCEIEEGRRENLAPAEIAARAAAGDMAARRTLSVFSGWLGAFAGNMALQVWAAGGVYLAGGVLPRLGPHFDRQLFRARFEAKGRFAPHLARMPVFLVTGGNPAFYGLRRTLIARDDR
ncbi:ROK family protein [Tepidicaulis sp. LMO-SS28]|uniref:glucokinase n=1 Tax=Tepidicaulis sp. LMO-SS28 TaxID=3447455 RepID=UPI003EE24004